MRSDGRVADVGRPVSLNVGKEEVGGTVLW